MTITSTVLPEYTQTKEFQSDVTVVSSSTNADTTVMTIAPEAAAHIQAMLTDLYSNTELAVIREYVSNAVDAHVEVNESRPIEISLPSNLAPTFIVQDYGVGMSADTIRKIYSSYGASTKRQNLDQIGAFGIGCKAALALTQQFSLVSVKDGMRTVASISRGSDGVGVVKIVSESKTDEPRGTKISIAIPRVYSFSREAKEFFKYPLSVPALLNGKPLPTFEEQGFIEYGPGIFSNVTNPAASTAYGHFFSVRLGGLVYRVNLDNINMNTYSLGLINTHRYQIIVDIPIGSIDLTPSREDIRYSDRSNKFLSELLKNSINALQQKFLADVSNAKTRAEAIKCAGIYESLFRNTKTSSVSPAWRGESVTTRIRATYHSICHTHNGVADGTTLEKYEFTSAELDLASRTSRVFIEDFSGSADDLRTLRRNALNWFRSRADSDPVTEIIIFVSKVPTSIWYTDNDSVKVITSDDLIKEAKEYGKANRKKSTRVLNPNPVPLTYPVRVGDLVQEMKISDLDKSIPWVIVEKNPTTSSDLHISVQSWADVPMRYSDFCADTPHGIVGLKAGRQRSALVKRMETAGLTIKEDLASDYIKWVRSWPDYDVLCTTVYATENSVLHSISELLSLHRNLKSTSKILLDKDLVECLTLASNLKEGYDTHKRFVSTSTQFIPGLYYNDFYKEILDDVSDVTKFRINGLYDYKKPLLEKYPMLRFANLTYANSEDLDVIVNYINDVYTKNHQS